MNMEMEMKGFEVINTQTGEAVQLAMQGLWLTGRITPAGARLVVVHTFRSSESQPVEVVYAFGLPRDAALRRFRIEGENFRAHSELRSTEEARQEYERGIQQGRLSGLAQTYRDGRVNLSVGNLRPGETVRVFLEMVAGVDLRDNGLRFRFPFTLAPCYHRQAKAVESGPGQGEMELPGDQFGDLLLPPFMRDPSGLHAVGFDISLLAGGRILSVASPSHTVKIAAAGAHGARVGLGVSKDVPDRDLVLDVESEATGATVLGGGCPDGIARFTVVIPTTLFDPEPASPRTVVFILDRSGSMEGPALDQARRAAAACLATLSDSDRFGVLAFDDSVELFNPDLAAASSAQRQHAIRFLDSIDARGGTELAQALDAGLRLAGGQGRSAAPVQADLFLLTDGQVSATEAIISRFRTSGARIHCLGIGAASQDRFLSLLARATGGVCRFLTPRERVDLGALELFASVGRPVATGLQVSFSGLQDAATVVEPPSAVFAGHPLVVMAKAAAPGHGLLQLAWAEGSKTHRTEFALASSPDAETIRLLQGARLITDVDATWDAELVERSTAQARQQNGWRAKLENLSREYGLASRAMALVAVIERPGDDASKVPLTRVVPVGLAQDVTFEGYVGAAGGSGVLAARLCCLELSDLSEDEPTAGSIRKCSDVDTGFFRQARYARIGADSPSTTWGTVLRGQSGDSGTTGPVDLDDLLISQFAQNENGGLPGPTDELRLVRSLAALLVLGLLGHNRQSGPFRVFFPSLVAFVRPRLASIPEADARRFMTRLVDVVEQGRIPDRPQNRAEAQELSAWLDAAKVEWTEIVSQWAKYLP
jgi:Ca-activated chloride channel homolog